MGDLPTSRVQLHRSFLQVVLDYGGPFTIKECRRRNAKTTKVYLALFICMAVKAVHIEIVTDLTSDAFLAALDRFVARREIPSNLYFDCGTSYIGAARKLKSLFHDVTIQNQISNHVTCNWHFNPPVPPHFGGLWEATIKSVRFYKKHSIGSQILTYEGFFTLPIRVEGILNSRLLTLTSYDPYNLTALIPGHFLIGQPVHVLPETNYSKVNIIA